MQEENDIVRYQVTQKRFIFHKSLRLTLHTGGISDIWKKISYEPENSFFLLPIKSLHIG